MAGSRFSVALLAVGACAGALGYLAAELTTAAPDTAAAPAPAAAVATHAGIALPDFAEIAARANPAVVAITSISDGERSGRRSHWFHAPDPLQSEGRSTGSGFLISRDGYVFTNDHVIEDGSRVQVELHDGRRFDAKRVGQDAETDLALLKIDADQDLPSLALGDSDGVRVGEWVAAFGNPYFYAHTVTVGVISAKGRRLDASSAFDSYLQTDAAINFGNSGGPLLNVRGEVIGINTAVSARGQNIGFAMPINLAKEILPQLRQAGRVARGYLGVSIGEGLEEDFRPPAKGGAIVNEVLAGEAGERAGLRAGDVIIEVNGAAVANGDSLVRAISSQRPGAEVGLTVIRDGESRRLLATLGERRRELLGAPAEPPEPLPAGARLGVALADLDRRLRELHRLGARVEGVAVIAVDDHGPAAETLAEGDVLLEVNRREVRSLVDLGRALDEVEDGDEVMLYVLRAGTRFRATVTAGDESR